MTDFRASQKRRDESSSSIRPVIARVIEAPFFTCTGRSLMRSYCGTVEEGNTDVQNVMDFELPENFSKESRLAPAFVPCVDRMPVSLLSAVIVGQLSPGTACFEYITNTVEAATEGNRLRLSRRGEQWLEQTKLLIGQHLIHDRGGKEWLLPYHIYVNST